MHCDRCNVDFSEGLRYCKWCGEALVDRPRITSELHSCPSCAAAIQPGWTFCKACGERLQATPRKPGVAACPRCGAENDGAAPKCSRCGQDLTDEGVAADSANTSVFAACASCGEHLDTGSLYCKGCGSAVYTDQPHADAPSGLTTVQQKVPTLPDLDEHIVGQSQPGKPEEQSKPDSGANTLVFTGPGQAPVKGNAETNMLTGTAGARSEQQAPTQVMQMGRITGPVESDDPQAAPKPSGELSGSSSPSSAELPPIKGQPVASNEATLEFAAVSPPQQAAGDPDTLGLGSESESDGAPAGSENKTAVFVSRPQEAPPASREQVSRDDIGTRPFTPPGASPDAEPTREFKRSTAKAAAPVPSAAKVTSAPLPLSPDAGDGGAAHAQSQTLAPGAAAPGKRTGALIATVVVVLVLLGAGGYVAWLLFGRGKPTPPVAPPIVEQPATPPPSLPETPPAPVIPEGMIAITAGAYTIGRDDGEPLEQPKHKVDLPAFYLDRAEVTNAAYKKFIDATGHKPPSNWTGKSFPEGRDDFPVTGVTWQDAADYAAWAGKRLPTESEWEAAARGTDGRIYPWGNGFRSGVANIGAKPDKATPEQYPAGIKQVGRYPEGASPAGAVDMIGNAWEWVADEIKVYPGNTESTLELEPGVKYRVIRGGAYDGNKDKNDATYRGYLDGSQPYPKVGFRCAKDAK